MSSSSKLVSRCTVRIELNGSVAVADAGVGFFELQITIASFGKHGRRTRIQQDGLGEQLAGFLEISIRKGRHGRAPLFVELVHGVF